MSFETLMQNCRKGSAAVSWESTVGFLFNKQDRQFINSSTGYLMITCVSNSKLKHPSLKMTFA